MGTVYLGKHVLVGREVAIKVLLPEMSTRKDVLTRFLNEARAASSIQHPGIVEIFDSGSHDDGSAYIVMELLRGESLGARLRAVKTLPEDRVVRLGIEICAALSAAHARGIVHRDLKPDNIFLVADAFAADGERLKLLDFGVAKLAADQVDEDMKTRTGVVLGTPTYMAPEQCRGTGVVDHRADLYSLACVLYRMLCGQPPFVSGGLGDLIIKHMSEPPPPLGSRVAVSPALEAVIMRALSKSPDDRFASAAEMAAQLARVAEGPSAVPEATVVSDAAVTGPSSISTLAAATGATSGVGAGTAELPRRRGVRWLMVVGVAIVAIAVVAVMRARDRRSRNASSTTETEAAPAVAAPVEPAPVAPSAPVAPPATVVGPAAQVPAPAPVVAPAPVAAPAPAPAPLAEAHLTITSTPPGADVYRLPDRTRAGVTPFELTAPRDGADLDLVISKRGFASSTVHVRADGDHTETVTLRPRAAAPATPKPPGEPQLAPGQTLNPFDQ